MSRLDHKLLLGKTALNKLQAILIFVLLIGFLLVSGCKKQEPDVIKPDPIFLIVELKDNLAYLSWKFNDTIKNDNFSIRYFYGTLRNDNICDTCTILTRWNYEKYYILRSYGTLFSSNDLNINSYTDSSFFYSHGLFYSINAGVESKLVKLKLPELSAIEIDPHKILIDCDLNQLIILDITDMMKVIAFDLNTEQISSLYEFNISETQFLPLPDIYSGVINEHKKLFVSIKDKIYILSLPDLVLEKTIQLEEYLGTLAYKDDYIYTYNKEGYFYKINYTDSSISKIDSELGSISQTFEMFIMDEFLYLFTVHHSGTLAAKYSIQPNGNPLKLFQKEFDNFASHDIYCDTTNATFILANGLVLNNELDVVQDFKLSYSAKTITMNNSNSTVTFSIPSKKVLEVYDINSSLLISKKILLSYPLFILSNKDKDVCIGDKYSGLNEEESICIEYF